MPLQVARIGFNFTSEAFKEMFERHLIRAIGEFTRSDVAQANDFHDLQTCAIKWREAAERILYIDAGMEIRTAWTAVPFDKFAALLESVAEYNSLEDWKGYIQFSKILVTHRTLKNPGAKLKTPDLVRGHAAFWNMVNEALEMAFIEVEDDE